MQTAPLSGNSTSGCLGFAEFTGINKIYCPACTRLHIIAVTATSRPLRILGSISTDRTVVLWPALGKGLRTWPGVQMLPCP